MGGVAIQYFSHIVCNWILINQTLPVDRDVVQLSTLEIRHKIAELEANLNGDLAGRPWMLTRGACAWWLVWVK